MTSPTPPIAPTASPQGDATGGVIPYKNPQALTAYYLGIFSIFPVLGFFLGCAAVPLGIIGLKKRKQNPVIKGSVHAWIGILGGGLSVMVHVAIAALIAYGYAQRGP
jgi:hypothetical protein